MSAQESIRIGLIGAGLFARDAHVPAIHALGDTFTIAAICSHNSTSAEQLAQSLEYPVDTTTDVDALLARDDIEAVDILLPIPLMPSMVRKALDAGKHVISEKPAAPDLATGRELLAQYARTPDLVWMVGENWRYEPGMVQAAEIVRSGEIGHPVTVQFSQHVLMTADNKYYHTAWRRENVFPGGFIMDGGVHYIALLRMVLGEIATVSAVARQMRADLPPVDTVSAALEFASGLTGSYNVSYAAPSPWTQTLHIVGDKGALLMNRDAICVFTESGERTLEIASHSGVNLELAAFAAAIRDGAAHRNSPQQALQDVAVIEAILTSAQTGRRIAVEKFI